jgi:hypothetical protein
VARVALDVRETERALAAWCTHASGASSTRPRIGCCVSASVHRHGTARAGGGSARRSAPAPQHTSDSGTSTAATARASAFGASASRRVPRAAIRDDTAPAAIADSSSTGTRARRRIQRGAARSGVGAHGFFPVALLPGAAGKRTQAEDEESSCPRASNAPDPRRHLPLDSSRTGLEQASPALGSSSRSPAH